MALWYEKGVVVLEFVAVMSEGSDLTGDAPAFIYKLLSFGNLYALQHLERTRKYGKSNGDRL